MIELSYTQLLQIIVDFGLVVLTWLVQLVIYPSFLYYQKTDLDRWHPIYTKGITWVVLPLMVTQLFVSIYQCSISPDMYSIIYLLFVSTTWLVTFIWAVPLHSAIENDSTPDILKRLVQVHTYRTVLWTIISAMSIWCVL